MKNINATDAISELLTKANMIRSDGNTKYRVDWYDIRPYGIGFIIGWLFVWLVIYKIMAVRC